MRSIARVAAALLVIVAALPATADARFKRCDSDTVIRCGTVTVPLDRTGRVPGRIGLHVEQVEVDDLPAGGGAGKVAGKADRGAIFALAGGPGQPATQFTSDFLFAFGDADNGRDLITFDQRGTGSSGLLRCPEIEKVTLLSKYADAGEKCTQRLGARRGLYTTSDSIDDMEAVRRAIGVDRIAIYGASYGTKVALAYAERYPDHVERLVLDSVVTDDGPDPLYRDTFQATARVERASCGSGCDFTRDAGDDLIAYAKQLGQGPDRGHVVDAGGRPRAQSIGSIRLLFLMLGGDFSPRIRAALPAAIYDARRGDPAQLLRLASVTESDAQPTSPRDFSAAVFAATICEEASFPWQRGSAFDDRERQAGERIAAIDPAEFNPFGSGTALGSDLIQLCSRWQEATPGPPSVLPAPPDVPALILEGEFDLRTPIEGARRVAAQFPRGKLLTIPATGHSTLGSDSSACTLRAISRFLARQSVPDACSKAATALRPEEPAPLTLTEVDPLKGAPRPVARALQALDLTLNDLEDQAATQAVLSFDTNDSSPVRGGGLRGGRFRVGGSGMSIDRAVFVPGVKVSGRLLNRAGRIGSFRVSGSPAVSGTVSYGGRGLISGRIGGHSFRFHLRVIDTTPPDIELGKLARPERPAPKVR